MIRLFEEFSNEIKSKDDLYLLLADFIEEEGVDLIIVRFTGDTNLANIGKLPRKCVYYCVSMCDVDYYYDIVERLVDHGLYVFSLKELPPDNSLPTTYTFNLNNKKYTAIYVFTDKMYTEEVSKRLGTKFELRGNF